LSSPANPSAPPAGRERAPTAPAALPADTAAPTAAAAVAPSAAVGLEVDAGAPGDEAIATIPSAGQLPAAGATPAGSDCAVAIDVASYGKRARVLIDGKVVEGASLSSVPVPCGVALKVAVDHPGYRKFEKVLTAIPGDPVRVEPRLRERDVQLRLVSNPEGAIVTVDGGVIGRTPTSARATPGETLFVTATLKGHKPWSREVRVKDARTIRIDLEAIGR
jgi:hypothetical protein